MTIEVYVASAFTKETLGGNKTGVVLDAGALNTAEKMKTASELRFSETAFVSQSEQADFALEYFTPTGEIPLCGYATIATFVVLAHLNLLKKSDYLIETKSGILKIRAEADGLIFMQQNLPLFYETVSVSDMNGCFDPDISAGTLPIQIVSTGLRDILIPVSSSAILEKITPNFTAISEICKQKNCVGIHAFSPLIDGNISAVCRNFAPLYGINEESATGTSNCALACYLYKYGVKQDTYIFEQGRNLNSLSRIYVHIASDKNTINAVAVGGYGYFVSRNMISV